MSSRPFSRRCQSGSSSTSPSCSAASGSAATASATARPSTPMYDVSPMVVVSIIGTDRFVGGYGAAKIAHEQVPTRNLVDMAELLVARRGGPLRIQAVSDAADPNRG